MEEVSIRTVQLHSQVVLICGVVHVVHVMFYVYRMILNETKINCTRLSLKFCVRSRTSQHFPGEVPHSAGAVLTESF